MTPVLAMQGALIEAPLGAAALRVTLADPIEAEPWLTRLLGPATAVDVLNGATTIAHQPLLTRLALVLWARRWWPTSPSLRIPALPGHLLALEAAALTAALDGHLDDVEATPQEWFDLAVAEPLTWSDARPALASLVDFFTEVDDDARAAQARHLHADATAPVPGDFALAAGTATPAATPAALVTGTASADWTRVPPGLLDAAEDTVRWSLVPVGAGASLRVEVAALPGSVGRLQAIGTTAEHQVVVDLAPTGPTFAGQTPLPDGVATAILDGHLELVVGSAGAESSEPSTPEARAAVVSWARTRATVPEEEKLLAERVLAW